MKTNIRTLVISGLVIIFSVNLYGCTNGQADIGSEQDDVEIIEEQYITEEDLQDSMQTSLEQERIIQDQSFNVDLNEWGNVEFVSYEPEPDINLDDISDHIAEEDLTVGNVYQYILNKDAENSTAEAYETGDEIKRIREYMIPDQSFDISLNEWGEVTFVSCMPMPDSDGYTDPHADVSFYLVSGEQIIYRFPYINQREGIIASPGVSFVTFTDVNEDGRDDVVIGILYFGVGYMQQNDPYLEVRIYIDNGNEFVRDTSRFGEYSGLDGDTTAEEVMAMLGKQ